MLMNFMSFLPVRGGRWLGLHPGDERAPPRSTRPVKFFRPRVSRTGA